MIEHVWDPVKIAQDALGLLSPGGLFFLVAHDRRAFSARMKGTKSPILTLNTCNSLISQLGRRYCEMLVLHPSR